MNDEIINATLRHMWDSAPYKNSRKILDTNYYSAANNDPTNPNLAQRFLRTCRNEADSKLRPKKDTPYILIPMNHNDTHWTLLVRKYRANRNPISAFYYDSLNGDGKEAREVYLKINGTPIINRNHPWTDTPVPQKINVYDCGVHTLMHAYVWLYHPNPETFIWTTLDHPHLGNIFRDFIHHILFQPHVPNIFATPLYEQTVGRSAAHAAVRRQRQTVIVAASRLTKAQQPPIRPAPPLPPTRGQRQNQRRYQKQQNRYR